MSDECDCEDAQCVAEWRPQHGHRLRVAHNWLEGGSVALDLAGADGSAAGESGYVDLWREKRGPMDSSVDPEHRVGMVVLDCESSGASEALRTCVRLVETLEKGASGRVDRLLCFAQVSEPGQDPYTAQLHRALLHLAAERKTQILPFFGDLRVTVPSTLGIVDQVALRENNCVEALFVYGTLRIDDPGEAPWKDPFNEGTISVKARVAGARLYHSNYPVVVLGGPESDQVVGFYVTTAAKEDWAAKLEEADAVEGFPSFYSRAIVQCFPEDGTPPRLAWIYHRVDLLPSQETARRIHSGDYVAQ